MTLIWRMRVESWISKATFVHAHAHAHTPGHPHLHKHVRARTHRQIFNIYCFSMTTIIRGLASILRYSYISPRVINKEAQIKVSQFL
jgi:hypothetical protein